jgi:hypothetical protein
MGEFVNILSGRQKRITIDKTDYFIDLLSFHQRLRCLIAVDLKLGDFEAGYKGQMELYLRYLEKYEQVKARTLPLALSFFVQERMKSILNYFS